MPSATMAGCPCGDEPRDALRGRGVLGTKCADRVVSHLRRWLQARYPDEHEDFVQDVYVKLLGEKGLATFVPSASGRADSFRGWLYGVVRNFALYTIQQRQRRAHIGVAKTEMLPEPTTGSQAFARICIREMVQVACQTVRKSWFARGPSWGERFEVFILFVRGESADYEHAQSRLRISYTLAKRVHHDLKEEVCFHVRAQVRDTLFLEPGLSEEAIEEMIDDEIRGLFDDAFPGSVWDLFFPEPKSEPEQQPTQPRSTP